MPHQRSRLLLALLQKRLKLWPVVGVIGVRQSGKSVLLRDLLLPEIQGKYSTLDSLTLRMRAQNTPEAFSEPHGRWTQIFDEIQKAPDLFDAIKLHVDRDRKPGMYIISGSTEFSKLTGVRESLTGRIGILRLYPMTLQELYGRKDLGSYWIKELNSKSELIATLPLHEFDKKLARGGMPGLCFIRDEQEFGPSCDMWLETSCYRDLQQIQGGNFDGALGLAILSQIARQDEPTAASIARALKKDARIITRYMKAFEAILVIHRIEPHPAGVGKAIYTLCDVGIAAHLGSSRESLIRTHLLFEALTLFETQGFGRPAVFYYRNEKTSRVPLVFDWQERKGAPPSAAVQFQDSEALHKRSFLSLEAFSKRAKWKGRLLMLSQAKTSYREGTVEVCSLRG